MRIPGFIRRMPIWARVVSVAASLLIVGAVALGVTVFWPGGGAHGVGHSGGDHGGGHSGGGHSGASHGSQHGGDHGSQPGHGGASNHS